MIFNSILIINYYDICIFMYKGRPTASCFSTKLGRRTSRSLHTRLASAGLLQVTRRQRSGVCPQLHHIQLWSKWMLKQQGPTPPGGYEDWWPKLKVNASSTPSFYLGLEIHSVWFNKRGCDNPDIATIHKRSIYPPQERLHAFTQRTRPQHDSVEAEQELQR